MCIMLDLQVFIMKLNREEVREMFYHGYENYMNHAFPDDELKPLSCEGRRIDGKNIRGTMDDTLGDYCLTLVDTLDMLIVLGDYEEFEYAVYQLLDHLNFNTDVSVNVFEVTIRVLGGLLSSHIFADELKQQYSIREGYLFDYQQNLVNELLLLESRSTQQQRIIDSCTKKISFMKDYNGELLRFAEDLGNRILPAFESSTGIPYSLINLENGKKSSIIETCLAGAGTLSLEFITLSKLTGNNIFKVCYIYYIISIIFIFTIG